MEYAYSFMEKFIQLPFLVPQPDKNNLETFLNEIFSVKETSRNKSFRIKIPIFDRLFRKSPNIYNFYNHAEDNTQSKTVERKEDKTQSRIEKIKIKEGTESQTIRDIIIMVAPALDDNPRRLKQFINLFRLKTFIAASTGLLDELLYIDNNTQQSGLTLEQLGKFTAIALKWPRLLVDLNVDRQLLKKLHNAALPTNSENESENDIKYDYITSYWSRDQKLIKLICYGCETSSSEERDDKYSLENVNVNQLLQVSPRVAFRGVDLPSEKGVDYTRLNQLLARKQWKEADDETYRVMLQVVGRSDGDWIRPEELVNFPCTDLLTIDNLWVKYSDGRFGFTVQKQIYLELGGKPDGQSYPAAFRKFGEKVGWKMTDGKWISYSQVKFDNLAPQGHLPAGFAGTSDKIVIANLLIFSRIETCKL